MVSKPLVWIDTDRCTGCGACVDVCSVGALSLVDGAAQLDEQNCNGCDACVEACPEDAIHPIVDGEIVAVQSREVQVREDERGLAPAMDRYRPLVESAGPALAIAGAGLLAKAARAVGSVVGRWLLSPEDESRPARSSSREQSEVSDNGGRRTRRRRRGQ